MTEPLHREPQFMYRDIVSLVKETPRPGDTMPVYAFAVRIRRSGGHGQTRTRHVYAHTKHQAKELALQWAQGSGYLPDVGGEND